MRLPEQVSLVLDCLPFAVSTYGREANLSSIQWFRRELGNRTVETEVMDNTTMINIKERLIIEEITIATGAQVGMKASYCSVCRNVVPPEVIQCAETSANVHADSEWAQNTFLHWLQGHLMSKLSDDTIRMHGLNVLHNIANGGHVCPTTYKHTPCSNEDHAIIGTICYLCI